MPNPDPQSASPSEWTSQLRRGVLELCVLAVLHHRESYGYEIAATLAAFGPLAAGENTLYPLLRRLKADGQLETYAVESPAGPPRHYYRLTDSGRTQLAVLAQEWRAMADAVARCLDQGDSP